MAPHSPDIIAKVAKVEERLSILGENIRDDVREIKDGQDEMWKEFRRNERLVSGLLTDAEKRDARIENLLISYRKDCDNRYETAEKNKRTKIAVFVFFVTTACNLGVDGIKKWVGLA